MRPIQGRSASRWHRCHVVLTILAVAQLLSAQAFADQMSRQYRYDAAGNIIAIEANSRAAGPVIHAIEPGIGRVGDEIKIYGHALSATTGQARVTFAGVSAPVLAAVEQRLVVQVPPGAVSGPVEVQVDGAIAGFPDPFYILPPAIDSYPQGIVPAQVDSDRLAIGFLAGTVQAVSFNGSEGELFTLNLFDWLGSSTWLAVSHVAPDGNVRRIGHGRHFPESFNLPPLEASGKHLIVFESTAKGVVELELTADARILVDEPPTRVSSSNQLPKRVWFAAQEGDSLGLGFSGLELGATSGWVRVRVFSPSGQTLTTIRCRRSYWNNCHEHFDSLPESGVYSVVLFPIGMNARIESASVWLSNDLIVAGELNQEQTIELPRPGQKALMQFDELVSNPMRLALSAISANGAGRSMLYQTVSGEGDCIPFSGCNGWSALSINAVAELPVSADGVAAIRLGVGDDGFQSGSGRITFVPSISYESALIVDGEPATFNELLHGQVAHGVFSAQAGSSFGLGISGLMAEPSGSQVEVFVLSPSGESLSGFFCGRNLSIQCHGYLNGLPESGEYRVLIVPGRGSVRSLSAKVWLSNDLAVVGEYNRETTISLSRPGQKASVRFSQPVTEPIVMSVSNVALTPSGSTLLYQVVSADGECIPHSGCNSWRMLSGNRPIELLPPSNGVAEIRLTSAGDGNGSGKGAFTVRFSAEAAE